MTTLRTPNGCTPLKGSTAIAKRYSCHGVRGKGMDRINQIGTPQQTNRLFLALRKSFTVCQGYDYPSNGARHSFRWRNFEWSLNTMGHISSKMYLKNYKNGRAGKEESDEYFSIKP